jgi:hypothetical protein
LAASYGNLRGVADDDLAIVVLTTRVSVLRSREPFAFANAIGGSLVLLGSHGRPCSSVNLNCLYEMLGQVQRAQPLIQYLAGVRSWTSRSNLAARGECVEILDGDAQAMKQERSSSLAQCVAVA